MREAAQKYEEDISGLSQEEDLELMDSQVLISSNWKESHASSLVTLVETR